MMYRAIIFDIDGTAVPLGATAANQAVRSAIATAQKTIQLAAATGRSFGYAQPILRNLGLTSPSVVMGGSAILDASCRQVLWSKSMTSQQSNAALRILKKYQADISISTDPLRNNQPLQEVDWGADLGQPIYTIWAVLSPAAGVQFAQAITAIPDVVAHSTPSWITGLVEVHVTHALATKEHAIRALVELLDVQPSETIGIGDSDNDIPLFRSVGHKVAMGNATPALKALADEIAPPLEQDGLAYIIDKYVPTAIS